MTHPILSRIPILRAFVDERFLEHRRRASSVGGFASMFVALALWEYRYLVEHIWSWDLLAIIATFGAVKMFMFFWYRIHD